MKGAARIAILGGGPIGLACALLLAQRRISAVVADARPLDEARGDARVLALSRGTWETLRPLLAADVPRHAAIREVHVSSAGEFGATHLSADDFDGVDLGATVLYGELLDALARAAASQALIEVRRPCRVMQVTQSAEHAVVALDDSSTLDVPLAVHAEGLAGLGDRRDTGTTQWALIADVRVMGPRPGSAFERFTREGPLALLPAPARTGDGSARTLALVWCMSDAESARRLAQPDDACVRELQHAIGARIGQVEAIGARRRYPLTQVMRETVREHRVVALGNAAQTLHPVAGQGFNLGMRDCVTLADALATHDEPGAALADYAARRRIDRAAIYSLTRWLPDAFATRFTPIAMARVAGLVALDLVPPLRRQLAHLLMFGART
ncbi:MAG: FAD-dependent monooxygenase [Gemmatimonadota bacterium]